MSLSPIRMRVTWFRTEKIAEVLLCHLYSERDGSERGRERGGERGGRERGR